MTILMMSIKQKSADYSRRNRIVCLSESKSWRKAEPILIRPNILQDFLGCSRPIFFIDIIRIVIPLAFQRHILNCSTAKTCDVTVKIVREVENYEQKLCYVREWGRGGTSITGLIWKESGSTWLSPHSSYRHSKHSYSWICRRWIINKICHLNWAQFG